MASGAVGRLWSLTVVSAIATVLLTFFFKKRKRDNPPAPPSVPAHSVSRDTDAESDLSSATDAESDLSSDPVPAHSVSWDTVVESDLSSAPVPAQGRSNEPSSSSPNSVRREYEYEVFLSFRGTDTRERFTDFLYHSLAEAGIRTFRDDAGFRCGEEISSEILEAIKQSRVSIPILSKGYASSKWCLMELAKMVECMSSKGQKVIPIFYDVSPVEVRHHRTGPYAEALSMHIKSENVSTKMIREWRDALDEVGALKGWDLTACDRYQGKAIEEVVSRVLKLLRKQLRYQPEILVGIEDHVEKVMRLLEIDVDDVKVVGICGMSGVGKTTLAAATWNQIVDNFEGSSFLEQIRERSRPPSGLQYLQAELLADISKHGHGEIDSVDEASYMLRRCLRNKKVLIILDDVDDDRQLQALVQPDWLGRGSRIIVTIQNNHVLKGFEQDACLYEVTELHPQNAFRLLCRHAFLQDSPPDEFASISWEIAKVTEGLPLSIAVTGSLLCGRSKDVWAATLEKLRNVPLTRIHDKLKITYDQLDDECKIIFLDIACFLVGMDVKLAVYMWRDCGLYPEYGIQNLLQMSLIKIGDDNKLRMPNQLRDLGRDIVSRESMSKPGKRSRLWGEAALHVIRRNEGTGNIEAICLDYGIGSSQHAISDSELKLLPQLRFLDLADANLCGNPLGCLSELRKLRWLGWHGTTRPNLPSSMYPENLLILDLSNSVVDETWDGWSPHVEAVNLKVLNLTNCRQLASTPRFSSFPHIEVLILQECSALTVVDPSIGHLKNLKFLDLRKCQKLEKLPDEIGFLVEMEDLLIDGCPIREIPISNGLKKLRTLSAKSCRLLTQIPQSIEFLVGLKELLLDDCQSLTELPTSVGQLNSLEVLSLSRSRVVWLPDSVGNSSNLRVLNIDHCPIRSFPYSVGFLGRLEVLNASWCLNLSGQIPFELGNLTLLRILRLDHTSITSIPRSIAGLSHLQTLDLEGCLKLLTLPELPSSLVNLKVTRRASDVVPNFTDLINLQQFEILNCGNSLLEIQEKSDKPSSSSSIPIQPGYEYEVLLSFRGLDTCTGFTDSLYQSLVDAGIRTFKDNEELRLGEEISSELLEAIEQSRISIPIFSKGYASSKWCLKELTKMVECNSTKKQKIIPIFYDVSPYQVRHQTETYAKAFSMHEKSKKFSTEMISEWREALAKVGALKGRDLTYDRHQGKVIRDLVSEVLKQLKKPYLDVTRHLVGIGDHMQKVTRLLDIEADDVKVVGICGMGGIGKTTIAKVIYNQLQDQFEYCSFLGDIREASRQSKGLESLQRQLVSDVLRCKHEKFANTSAGRAVLVRSVHDKRVLILLDDVDQTEQLNNLVGDLNWLGQGSRVIVTARKVDVLHMSNVFATAPKNNASVYEVEEMHPQNAFLLFCKHAFRQDFPLPDLASISWKIVEATGGLPLAIVAIGSYLSIQKKKGVWEEALRSLKTRTDILDKLKISYDALSREQKEIFLDIVCLFAGMDSRIPVHVWKTEGFSPKTTIEDLQLRSLIRIGDNSELLVHDLYRELGREIIRDESKGNIGKQSRLWCSEDAIRVLQNEKGTKTVKAINLDDGMQSKTCFFSSHKFEKLANVWFLGLGNANLSGNFQGLLPDLRWLSHHGSICLNIPDGLNMGNLVVLDLLRSSVDETWNGWNSLKVAVNLKVLNLTNCHLLASTPSFSSFPHIEMLILQGCGALSVLDPSIRHLKNLKFLDLRNCGNLEKLPDEICFLEEMEDLLIDGCPIQKIPISNSLKKLRTLSAKSCRLLTQIPQSIKFLVALKELLLDDCQSLTELPTSVGLLDSLEVLSLSHTRVVFLPDSVGKLNYLRVLNIERCPTRSLPLTLGMLERLEELNASGCLNLSGEIPFELGGLKLLRTLILSRTSITSIPVSIVGLSHLQTLDLEGCVKLQTLPELPSSLVNLKVTRTAWEAIPNRTKLINLLQLDILNCSNCLVKIQGRSDEPSSSSSIPVQPGYEYEVFLSFRGPDTRTRFTDSLYHSLVDAGIRTFRDDEELRVGEEIKSELLEAIEQSRVSIPIFSDGYASSKWCLKEVAKMVECNSRKKQKIIPIFYDVSPDQVRHQTGTYAEAFSEHLKSKKFSTEMIREWRDALRMVGSIKGWDLAQNRYEGKVINKVVSEVRKQLKKPYLDVTRNLVGIEDHMEKIMRLLEINANDVKVVGIWGMGGIGKTTIAKFVYNQLQDQFEYCSFLKDVREASQQSKGLESLQRQLVSDVLRRNYENFANTDAGKSVLIHSLRTKKVLVLLDDVDHIDQLNNLVGDLNWLGQGSRIIITARKVDALRISDVFTTAPRNNASIYKVEEMHPHNAFVLFCKHAFRQDFPPPNLASISWEIVEATGRLPLAIVNVGSYLSIQKEKGVWEEALSSLKTRTDILDKLKISYEALNREQREVFLDIVCLVTGMDRRIPIHVWKARGFSPETTIEDLQLRSLIRIGEHNELLVHDLYRELGREIIRAESKGDLGKQSRLWCREDAIQVLQNEKGSKDVKAINLDHGIQSETCCFNSHKFEKLSNVWFLGLGNANLDGNFQGRLSDLRWLGHHGFDFLNIQNGLNVENLVVLDLSRSNVQENWRGWNSLKVAKKLEVLNLSSCHQLTSTPNFPPLPRMKRLILIDCRALVVVGPSIRELKALEFLDLRNCSSLMHLPEELDCLEALKELLIDGSSVQKAPLSRNMENLEIISARSCRSLIELQLSTELLKLRKLFLDNCESLIVVPHSIGQLTALTDLSLSRTSTIIIPESIRDLSNLELLNIDHCPIRSLPHTLWKLERLEVLSASGCLGLDGEISCEIGNMTSLRILCLNNTNVSSIPGTVKRLPSLHTLNLKECRKMETLPNLPCSLVNLKVTCMSFDGIPNLSDLVHLEDLEVLLRDKKAIVLRHIENFPKIQKLSIAIM